MLYLGLFMTLAAFGADAEADAKPAPPPPVRLLVITGSHGFDSRFYGLFEQPGIEWDKKTQTSKPCAAFTPGFADGYDAVLLYDFEFTITQEQRDALTSAFGGGRGLIVLHHALCSHQTYWPEWRDMIGGGFFFMPKDGRPASTFTGGINTTYEVADPEHPVTQGIPSFTVVEEPYKNVYIAPDAIPLLKSSTPESDPVVAWTRNHGESRIVCIVPGHGGDIFVDEHYKKFLAQAIRWVAKK